MELKLFINGCDTCFYVDYEPDTGIDEVRAASQGDPALIEPVGLFVGVGAFPEIRTVPLLEELNRLADIEFSEHRAEWLEQRRDAAAEHRSEAYD